MTGSRYPTEGLINKIIGLMPDIPKEILIPGSIILDPNSYETIIKSFATYLMLPLFVGDEDSSILRSPERALGQKHQDGAIMINSSCFIRDTDPEYKPKHRWTFMPKTKRVELNPDDKPKVSLYDASNDGLVFLLHTINEKVPKEIRATLGSRWKDVRITDDSAEGTLAFGADTNVRTRYYMADQFEMTPRRESLGDALSKENRQAWLYETFGQNGQGGGYAAMVFGTLYEAIYNTLFAQNPDWVFGMRVSENSQTAIRLEDCFLQDNLGKRAEDRGNDGYVGANSARYLYARVKPEYRDFLFKIFNICFNEYTQSKIETNFRISEELGADVSKKIPNLKRELDAEEVQRLIVDSTSYLVNYLMSQNPGFKSADIFDLIHGEMGLYDKERPFWETTPLPERRKSLFSNPLLFDIGDTSHLRGFNRKNYTNIGFYVTRNSNI